VNGALLVAGTTSDAGKSVVTAGICRWLVRQGVSVAPFKAQNMSNNSMVTADGAEIGRAQVMQAAAARVEPEAAMNPVLLKPGGEDSSQVVVLGRPVADVTALSYRPMKAALLEQVLTSLADLRSRFDVVVCEGAGSPTEINLRADDIANMGLATAAQLPVVVVGDIDRGGVFAALYGTYALLEEADRKLITCFVINKFRGDLGVLAPGLEELTRRTQIPVAGVLPWLEGIWLDGEDTLQVGAWGRPGRHASPADLTVAVIRLPRVSNLTDVDALAAEPGVDVRVTADPGLLADADLAVLPGSRSTVADLAWLRGQGLDRVLLARARRGAAVLGICGGYQMLGATIWDERESGSGLSAGLGLLPIKVRFEVEKQLGRPRGTWRGHPVQAYEIHHGLAELDGEAEPFLDGCRAGPVWGTMWHGTLENDGFRRAWLAEIAASAGSAWHPDPDAPAYRTRRETMIDTLADALETHLDLDLLLAGTRLSRP
jgi:adenosylcobyric acid synthase